MPVLPERAQVTMHMQAYAAVAIRVCGHMQPDGGCRAAGGGARRRCGGAAGDWPGGSPPRDGAREKTRGGVAYRDKEEWRMRSAPAADPEPESDTDPVYPQLCASARDGRTRRAAAPFDHDAAARSGAVEGGTARRRRQALSTAATDPESDSDTAPDVRVDLFARAAAVEAWAAARLA